MVPISTEPASSQTDAVADTFELRDAPVDVLFAMDDSGSMSDEQNTVILGGESIAEWFVATRLDYHLGVITMDASARDAGKLRSKEWYRWVDRDTPEPVRTFDVLFRPGQMGSPRTKGRATMYLGLTAYNEGANRYFLPPG